MKKSDSIGLQIAAIHAWFDKFGKGGLSDEKQRLYMSDRLIKLRKDLEKIEGIPTR